MTTPTVNVTLTVNDQTGAAVAGATVTARLTGVDLYNAITVFPATQTFTTDVNGLVTMPLFPNALGTRNTAYQFKATDPVTGKVLVNATLVIPNAAVDVSALIGNTPAGNPYPLPSVQPYSDILTSMASLTTAADKMHYWSGEKQAALTTITAYGRSIVATANAAAMIALMGLGTMATQNASAVAITGGTINATVIGGTTPAAGAFTTVSATGQISSSALAAINLSNATYSQILSASNMYIDTTANNINIRPSGVVAGVFSSTGLAVTGTISATGVATFPAGTVALPSITTSGDLNTGIYFPAADTVGITAGGTQRGAFSSTGLAVTGVISATGTVTGNRFEPTGATDITTVNFAKLSSGAIINSPAATTGYLTTAGSGILSWNSSGVAITGTLSTTGVATFAAGTVALPSITTSGDTNTGVYFPAADTVGITAGGVENLRIGGEGILVTRNVNGAAYSKVLNTTSGSAAYAAFNASNGTYILESGVFSATYTTAGVFVANSAFIQSTNNLAIVAAGTIFINPNGSSAASTVATITSTGLAVTGRFSATTGINSTTIGATTPAAGAFTTVSATGVATFAAGTVALPSITTSGDTNTGVYFPAADTVGITTGGVEAARFSGSTLSMTGSPAVIRNISGADGPGLRVSATQLSVATLNGSSAIAYSGAALIRVNTNTDSDVGFRIDANSNTTNSVVATQYGVGGIEFANSPIFTSNSATTYSAFHGYTTHASTFAGSIGRAAFLGEVDHAATYAATGTSANSAFFGILRATNAVTVTALRGADIVLATIAAATIAEVTGFNYRTASIVGGATVTDHRGIRILPQTAGTNIYGIASEIAAAASRWNLYVSGTAQNYFAGNVGIGATVPGAKLEINTGLTTTVGQIIQMVASQTADVLRVTRSDSNLSLQFTPTGQLSIGDIAAVASTVITTGPSTSTNANLKVSASNVGNPNLFIQSFHGGGGSLAGPTSFVYFGDNNRALSYIGGTKINTSAANASSDLVFGTTSDISTIAVTERMRINSSGIVLVGTASATGSNLLQVNSDIRVNGFTLGKGASSVATNTGFGLSVFSAITTGAQNTAFGYGALSTDTTGFGNAAFGLGALNFNNGGAYNTALGHSTLYYNTIGTQNTAVGHACMGSGLTTGAFNTGVGYTAVQMCTTGVATLGAITGGTGYTNGTYPGVVMTLSSGSAAATYPTATIVVAGGVVTTVTITSAGTRFVDTTTVLTAPAASIGGTGSGFSVPVATLIYGSANTGVGHQAILFTTVGGANTAIGYQAGRQNTTGSSNTSLGSGAGYAGVTASNNTSIGYLALQLATGGSNIGLGYNSGGAITTGTGNVIIGGYTGSTAPISTTGSNSIVFSDGAGNVRQYYDGTNSAWVFNTGATERMRINSSGNVGIGTASPAQKLDVYGDAIFGTSGWIKLADTGTGNGNIKITATGSNDFGGSFLFRNLAGSSEYMRIDPSGNVGIGTASPSASAILDAQSTTKGVRMPNMTTVQKNAIATPAAGLMVFDTTLAKLCVYTTAWETITSV
jgi:hypothetical protein